MRKKQERGKKDSIIHVILDSKNDASKKAATTATNKILVLSFKIQTS